MIYLLILIEGLNRVDLPGYKSWRKVNERCLFLCVFSVAVPSECVQNAYIVAVEEDAKRRLEELLYNNHKLTPVDMTKNVEVEEGNDNTTDSYNNNLSHSLDLSIEQAVLQSSMPFMTQSGHMTNGHVEMTDMNGIKDGKKVKGNKGKRSSTGGSSDTPMIDNLLTERMNNSQNSINDYTMDDSIDDMQSAVEFDPCIHREMPIDVPKNFQGAAKTPPRLPSTQSSPRSTPVKENIKNGKSNNNTQYTDEQMDRIRHHQEEIRKRNERDELRAKEQDFLRASLRRSEKMRALQKERKQAGVDNSAYVDNDDDSGGFEEGYVSGRHTQNSRDYMKKNVCKYKFNDILQTS